MDVRFLTVENSTYASWAARKAAELERLMFRRNPNAGFVSKVFEPASGVFVYLRRDPTGTWKIRITGSAVAGRRLRQKAPTPSAAYYGYHTKGDKPKLDRYVITSIESLSNPYPRVSFDGGAVIYQLDNTTVTMSYRHAAEQSITVPAGFLPGMYSSAEGGSAKDYGSAFTSATSTEPSTRADFADFLNNRSVLWVNEDGTLLMTAGTRGYPDIYRLSGTSYVLESTGEPAVVTSYKASLTSQAFKFTTADPSVTSEQQLLYGPINHFDSGAPYYARIDTAAGTGSFDSMRCFPSWDYFNDVPLLLVRSEPVHHVTTVDTPPDSRMYHMYVKRVETLYRYAGSGVWTQIDQRTSTGAVAYQRWEETIGGGFNGLTGTDGSLGGITIRNSTNPSALTFKLDAGADRCPAVPVVQKKQPARLAWIDTGQDRTGQASPPVSNGSLSNVRTPHVILSGAQQAGSMSALSTSENRPLITAWAPSAILYTDVTPKVFDMTTSTTADLGSGSQRALSPDGSQLLSYNNTSSQIEFYYQGTLKRTYAPAPAASAAYVSAPANDGFWFIDVVRGWSNARTAIKMTVYHHTVEGPPGVYTWVKKTLLVQYKPTSDTFKVLKTYTATLVVPHQNPADPNSLSITLLDSELIQDELLPNKSLK